MKLKKIVALVLSLALLLGITAPVGMAKAATTEEVVLFEATKSWGDWDSVMMIAGDGKVSQLDSWTAVDKGTTDFLSSSDYVSFKIQFKLSEATATAVNKDQWKLMEDQAFKFYAQLDAETPGDAATLLTGMQNPYDGTVFNATDTYSTVDVPYSKITEIIAASGAGSKLVLMTGNCSYEYIKIVATKNVAATVPQTGDVLVFIPVVLGAVALAVLVSGKKKTVRE